MHVCIIATKNQVKGSTKNRTGQVRWFLDRRTDCISLLGQAGDEDGDTEDVGSFDSLVGEVDEGAEMEVELGHSTSAFVGCSER